MSENNLKIRGKFINKFVAKIESLNNDFELLSKVDKKIFSKIFKTNINQVGGEGEGENKNKNINLNELQIETLKKKLILQSQQRILDNLKKEIDSINSKIPGINDVLRITTEDIQKLNINIPDLKSVSIPTVSTISPGDLKLLEQAYNDQTTWLMFFSKNKDTELIKKKQITEIQYARFMLQHK